MCENLKILIEFLSPVISMACELYAEEPGISWTTFVRFLRPCVLRPRYESTLHDGRIYGIEPATLQSTALERRFDGTWGRKRPLSRNELVFGTSF